jgi:hypothetical protein
MLMNTRTPSAREVTANRFGIGLTIASKLPTDLLPYILAYLSTLQEKVAFAAVFLPEDLTKKEVDELKITLECKRFSVVRSLGLQRFNHDIQSALHYPLTDGFLQIESRLLLLGVLTIGHPGVNEYVLNYLLEQLTGCYGQLHQAINTREKDPTCSEQHYTESKNKTQLFFQFIKKDIPSNWVRSEEASRALKQKHGNCIATADTILRQADSPSEKSCVIC